MVDQYVNAIEDNALFIVSMVIVLLLGVLLTVFKKKADFVKFVPTLLTTLGIFGTFWGIFNGLLSFDSNNIDNSIPPLLEGLKTAFLSSLVGIGFSILFKCFTSIIVRSKSTKISASNTPDAIKELLSNQLDEIKQLRKSLNERDDSKNHALLQEHLDATKKIQEALVGNEEFTLFGQLKILRADINDNTKNVRRDMEELALKQQTKFVEFSDKLWIKLQDFADVLSKSATEQVIEALNQVISDFNNNLSEQFGENFKQLNQAVGNLVEWQENYKIQLEQMKQQYEKGVESITDIETSVLHISEQSQKIPEAMQKLEEVIEINQHQISELERHLEVFATMRDKATDAVPHIQQQLKATMDEISSACNTASEHYQDLLTESDNYIKSHIDKSNELLEKFVFETNKGIENVGNELVKSSEKIGQEVERASSEFITNTQKTNESLNECSETISQQAQQIKQQLQESVQELNTTLNLMISGISDGSREMASTLKDANQNLIKDTESIRTEVVNTLEKMQQRLSDIIDETATQQVNQAKRTFDSMEEQIKQQVGLTTEAVNSQLKLIDASMQEEISRVMNEMGQALATISKKFVDDYVVLVNAMNDIVNQRVA